MNSPRDNLTKTCKSCGKTFYKKSNVSRKNWEITFYCSRSCVNKGRKCPWSGKKLPWDIWNKGKRGVQVAWNKGIHCHKRFDLNKIKNNGK